jgi:7-carboxy-7-deazaguanine synthase
MQGLLERGKTVLLETGGHRNTARVPDRVVTILDVKCPGSGEAEHMDWTNLDRLRAHDEVKFVVKDRADYDYARDVIARYSLLHARRGGTRLPGAWRARSAHAV